MIPFNCATVHVAAVAANAILVYPNPFSTSIFIVINNASQISKSEMRIYNVLGAEVMNAVITKQITTLKADHLASGIYFYKVISNNKTIQSGRLVSQQ